MVTTGAILKMADSIMIMNMLQYIRRFIMCMGSFVSNEKYQRMQYPGKMLSGLSVSIFDMHWNYKRCGFFSKAFWAYIQF